MKGAGRWGARSILPLVKNEEHGKGNTGASNRCEVKLVLWTKADQRLDQLSEFFRRNTSLAENSAQSPGIQFRVIRHHNLRER